MKTGLPEEVKSMLLTLIDLYGKEIVVSSVIEVSKNRQFTMIDLYNHLKSNYIADISKFM